jgi:hypothetical protein
MQSLLVIRTVKFDERITVYELNDWPADVYLEARRGQWMQHAVDRCRFKRRIKQTEIELGNIFSDDHRKKAKFTPVSAGLCLPVACRVTRPHAAGLWQRDTDWHSTTSHSSAAVGHERRCTLDPLGLKVPAYHTAPASAPLAEDSGAD